MSNTKVTIQLTNDQQELIRSKTGKSLQVLNIDLAGTESLSDKELDQVSGGSFQWGVSQNSADITITKSTDKSSV